MTDFPVEQERLLKQLIRTFRCSVCRRGFQREQVRVAARQDQLWIVSVRCGHCRDLQIFCFNVNDVGEADVLRDVSNREDEPVDDGAPLSYDDVLDMHGFLERFDGDFGRLFSR